MGSLNKSFINGLGPSPHHTPNRFQAISFSPHQLSPRIQSIFFFVELRSRDQEVVTFALPSAVLIALFLFLFVNNTPIDEIRII